MDTRWRKSWTERVRHIGLFISYIQNIVVITKARTSAGDNDQRSKRFCSNAVLCVSVALQIVKTSVVRLRVTEGPNALDQIAFYAFHSFLAESQTNAGYVHATHA